MSGLKLYADTISPVCRSIMLLLSANGIPYQKVEVSLAKRETVTNAELAAINPTKKVPALDDNGFKLFESNAILRYLVQKYDLPDHWYPKDLQRRAKIDEAIIWFHGGLRCGAFFWGCVMPKRTGERNEAKIAETTTNLKNALNVIENYFLKDKKFVGGDEISIADLQFLGEMTQYWLAGVDPYKGRPNMERWMEECQKVLNPHFEQIYQVIYEIRKAGTFSKLVID